MNKNLLLGFWKHLIPIPRPIWHRIVGRNAGENRGRLASMTAEHHKVRDFVVLNLPKCGVPLTPAYIAENVGLSLTRTREILAELEKGMTFLFRNDQGEVAWAYPVTVEQTPHHITLSTGEQIYAA